MKTSIGRGKDQLKEEGEPNSEAATLGCGGCLKDTLSPDGLYPGRRKADDMLGQCLYEMRKSLGESQVVVDLLFEL